MCLGETIRMSTTLHSLRMEGASRLSEILPGKTENRLSFLQKLSVRSFDPFR